MHWQLGAIVKAEQDVAADQQTLFGPSLRYGSSPGIVDAVLRDVLRTVNRAAPLSARSVAVRSRGGLRELQLCQYADLDLQEVPPSSLGRHHGKTDLSA